jgi:hypothetical protein
MNIIDILIQLVTYLLQNFLLPILPVEMPFFTLADLNAQMTGISSVIIAAFGGWGVIFPVLLGILLITCVTLAELYLFGFRIVKYGIEFFARR